MKKKVKENTEQPEKKEKIPWDKIKHDYVTGEITYMELSKKYNVSLESIKKQARKTDKRKGWVSLKREHRNKVYEKAEQKEAEKAAKEIVTSRQKVKSIADELISAMQTAVRQLSEVVVEHSTVTKTQKYEGKNMTETVTAVKDIEIMEGLVNTKALREISDSLTKVSALLAETDTEEDKFGIIELPAMEMPVPPSDDDEAEEGGDEDGGNTDASQNDMDSDGKTE